MDCVHEFELIDAINAHFGEDVRVYKIRYVRVIEEDLERTKSLFEFQA